MGRFDALIQLEDKQEKITPPPVAHSPTPSTATQSQPVNKNDGFEKKPTKLQNHKTTKLPASLNSPEKPEKYTTHLDPSLIRKIKLYAAETEMKDYQVVQKALLLYFEKLEKDQ